MNIVKNAIFVIAILALSACGPDSKATSAASTVIKHYLLSPASFSEQSSKIVWKGKNRAGKNAYMVNVIFDSANGFGAIIRACNTVVFTLEGEKVEWVDGASVNGCFDTNDTDTRALMRSGMFPTEQSWLSMLASSNNIDLERATTKVDQQSVAAANPAPAPAVALTPEPV